MGSNCLNLWFFPQLELLFIFCFYQNQNLHFESWLYSLIEWLPFATIYGELLIALRIAFQIYLLKVNVWFLTFKLFLDKSQEFHWLNSQTLPPRKSINSLSVQSLEINFSPFGAQFFFPKIDDISLKSLNYYTN